MVKTETVTAAAIATAATGLVGAHTVRIKDPRASKEARYAGKVWSYAPTVGKPVGGAVTVSIVCNAILEKGAALEMLREFRVALIEAVGRQCRDRRRGKVVFNRIGFWNLGAYHTTGWCFTMEEKRV